MYFVPCFKQDPVTTSFYNYSSF